jgi:hypothetical protein
MTSANNVHFSSRGRDWLTPPLIIERASSVLGAIDLDPCASSEAPGHVPAKSCFTQALDGLTQAWVGRIYMNPPYGRSIGKWVRKLRDEYRTGHITAAIALFPARTDTAWWQLLADYPVCFIRGRLRFSGHENSAPFPSAVVYLGSNIAAFSTAFSDIGIISCLMHGCG